MSPPFLAVLETSLTTLVVGIVLAFLLGFPLGVLARSGPSLRMVLGPVYAALAGFPAAAFSGLAMVWVGLTPTMAFVMVVASALFPIAVAVAGPVRPEPWRLGQARDPRLALPPHGIAPWPPLPLPGGVRPREMPHRESFGADLAAALRSGLAWGLVGLLVAESLVGNRGVFGFAENAMRLSDIPLAIAALAIMAVPTMVIGGLLFGLEQALSR